MRDGLWPPYRNHNRCFYPSLLSRADVDVNVQDNEGKTPLHIALSSKKTGLVRVLVAREDCNINLGKCPPKKKRRTFCPHTYDKFL